MEKEKLIEKLENKNIYKIAIVDDGLCLHQEEIYNKGFNEILNLNLARKIKYIEEIEQTLKRISLKFDSKDAKLPCVIVEDDETFELVKESDFNSYLVSDNTTLDIYEKIITLLKINVFVIYITNQNIEKTKHIEKIRFNELIQLPNIENERKSNLKEKLKITDEELINYNNFISTFMETLRCKKTLDKNIYEEKEITFEAFKQEFRIAIVKSLDELQIAIEEKKSDIVIYINENKPNNSRSILTDDDVNYIYTKYLNEPGKI